MNTKVSKCLDQTLTGNVFNYFSETENLIQENTGVHDNKCLSLDAYDPPCPVQKGVYTKVKITDECVDIINMDKSSISARLWFQLNFNGTVATELNDEYTNVQGGSQEVIEAKRKALSVKNRGIEFFVGFKSSIHFLDGYRIYSKGKKTACEQTEALHENAMMRMLKTQEELDEKPYVFTTWEKAHMRDDSICGTYITAEDIRTGVAFNGRTPRPGVVEVIFYIIVPLDEFLPLSAMTMYPACVFGNITMELKLAIQNNLVLCQCDPKATYDRNVGLALGDSTIDKTNLLVCANEASKIEAQLYTHAFTQIGDPMKIVIPKAATFEASGELKTMTFDAYNLGCDCIGGAILEMRSNLNGFNIKDSTKQQIRERYSTGNEYIIPAQFVDYQAFSQSPTRGGICRCNTTYALTNCTGIGLLFPRTHNELTCARNPHLTTFQLQIDNKPYPDKPFSTHDAVHAAYCMTNCGFDSLFSCSREYSHSLKFRESQNIALFDGTNTLKYAETPEDNTSYCLYCATQRLCGFGTYCDGLSKDNAQISLSLTLEQDSPYAGGQPPIMLILQDCFWRCTEAGIEFVYNNKQFAEIKAGGSEMPTSSYY